MLEIRLAARRGDFTLVTDLVLPTPGITALVGRSGCGKSTLINLLAGLLTPQQGHISIDGTTLYDDAGIDVPPEQRAVGYVFQDARLFPHLSAAANLRYGANRARGRDRGIGFDATVDLLGLGALLARHPHELSGGERQRVAIGRALLAQPRLLLLDEPLASLDTARREEILPALERLRDETALPMVYVSHQFDEVLRLATQVVVMEAGRVSACGDLAAVSRSPALVPLVGTEGLGAVVEGEVESAAGGLARVRVGGGVLQVETALAPGQRVRIQLLARDVMLAIEPPRGLSVRNSLGGVIRTLEDDGGSCLLAVDVGGPMVLVRVTQEARGALRLQPGLAVWVLVKAVSLRGHVFPGAGGAPGPA